MALSKSPSIIFLFTFNEYNRAISPVGKKKKIIDATDADVYVGIFGTLNFVPQSEHSVLYFFAF